MIIVQLDAADYDFALLLIRSLALHEPHRRVLADTVNLNAGQQAQLARAHPALEFIAEMKPEDQSPRDGLARRRSVVLHRAFDRFPDEPWFAMFDAATLVRRSLPDLWSMLDHHQAALLMTNGVWEGRVYPDCFEPSGLVLVRRDGRELVDRWVRWETPREPLHAHAPGEWFWDQCTLLQACEESRVDCAAIPVARFRCGSFSPDAAIWSAHGPARQQTYESFAAEHEVQRLLRTHPLLADQRWRPGSA